MFLLLDWLWEQHVLSFSLKEVNRNGHNYTSVCVIEICHYLYPSSLPPFLLPSSLSPSHHLTLCLSVCLYMALSLYLSVCIYLSILRHITVLKYFFPLLVSVCLSVLSLCLSERGERLHWGFKNMILYQFYFSYRMSHGLLMVRWIVGSIPNFWFQPVLQIGVTKTVVCAVLSVKWCIWKIPSW